MDRETKTDKGSLMKEKIFAEAVKLFLQKGYRGTSITDILTAADLSKGAFYYHVKSKNELLERIIELYDKDFLDGLIMTVASIKGGFLEKFRIAHKYVTEYAYRNRDQCVGFVTIAAEFAGSRTATEARIKEVNAKFINVFKELIDLGKKEDKIDVDADSFTTGRVVVGFGNGVLLDWYMNGDEIDGRSIAKTYYRLCVRGLLKDTNQASKKKGRKAVCEERKP
jgi:AcrR family transcriptional regulator